MTHQYFKKEYQDDLAALEILELIRSGRGLDYIGGLPFKILTNSRNHLRDRIAGKYPRRGSAERTSIPDDSDTTQPYTWHMGRFQRLLKFELGEIDGVKLNEMEIAAKGEPLEGAS
jgi:hypothetical protein